MSKHTPGPWKFISKPKKWQNWEVKDANGYTVVSFPGPDSGEPELDAFDLANGPLIAAAPEMLALLKCLANAEYDDTALRGKKYVRTSDIDKIIRKAEGR